MLYFIHLFKKKKGEFDADSCRCYYLLVITYNIICTYLLTISLKTLLEKS